MSLRAPFQDVYVIETQLAGASDLTTLLASPPDFLTLDSPIGAEKDKLQYYLNSHPDLNPNPRTIITRKATGNSSKKLGVGGEFRVGIHNPASSWEFEANGVTLALPLWLLLQNGIAQEQSIANFSKRVVPYTSSDIEVYASIGRNLGIESQVIDGCIVQSLSLSAVEGGVLEATANFIGAAYKNDVDGSSWNNSPSLVSLLLWQNASITLRYNNTNGIKLTIPNFNLNINNNAESKHYNSQEIYKYTLGELVISGNMKIPRDIINYEGNQVIDDWLDITNNLGVSRPMFIMWGGIESGGGSSVVDTGGVAGTNTIIVTDISNFSVGDVVILDIGNEIQEFGIISAIDSLTLTFHDKFVYTHSLGSGSVREAGRDFFGIRLNVRYDSAPINSEDELTTDVSFTCVDDEINKSIMIGIVDNVDRSIP